MALIVGELAAVLKLDKGGFDQGLGQSKSALEGLGKAASGLLATAAMAAVAALSAASVAAVKLGVDYNMMLETSQAKWETLLGSQAAAQEQLKWMADFAATTPFEFEELDTAASRLKAFGFTIEETRSLLGTLGDAAAATGKGTVALDALANSLGKIQGTGKVTTEALNMMSDQGINGFKMLGQGLGVSEAKLREMVEKGLLPAGKAIPILAKGLDAAFGGAMQKQAETFSGRLSTIKDNAKQLLGVAFKPLFDWLSGKALPFAIDLVDRLSKGFAKDGLAGALQEAFGPTVKAMIMGVIDGLAWLVDHRDLMKAAVIGMAAGFAALKALQLIKWYRDVVAAQGLLNVIMSANPIGLVVVGIGLLVAAGYLLVKNWDTVKRAALNAWGAIKSTVYTVIAAVIDKYAKFIGFFSETKAAEAKAAADSFRAQAQAEADFIDERAAMEQGAADSAAQTAADAEEAKGLAAWKSSTERQNAAKQAGAVEEDVWARMTQASADSTDQKAEKQKEFLDEFERGWDDAANAATTTFERAQDDATTAFERAVDDRLTEFERGQDREKGLFERAQDDKKVAFERALDDEKTTYERHQNDLLDTFKARQDAELSALQDRQDAERAAVDAEFAAQINALKADKDRIRDEQAAEESAKRQASLTDRITKAEEDLAKARLTKDPEKIANAREDLANSIAALAEWETNEERKQQTERIDNAIEALRQEQAERQTLLKQQQDAEKAELQTKQQEALAAYQQQLADEKTEWLRAQEDRKSRFTQELDDQTKAFDDRQKGALEHYKRQQEDEKTAWDRVQEDRATRYKQELTNMHDSFTDKLDAQREFVRDWNRNAARMREMAPGADGGTVPTSSSGGGGGSGRTSFMAKGGILNRPTFVAGEAGSEVVAPLKPLWNRIAAMAEQVSQRTAAAITGGASLAQQVAQQVATVMAGGMQAMPGGVPVNITVESVLDGQVLARAMIKHSIPILRQTSRAMG